MLKYTIIGLVLGGGIAFGGYYLWMTLPPETRAKVAGWKTNAVAAVIAFAPDAMILLAHFEQLSTLWEPSPTMSVVMKVVGGLMVALRMITSKEQKEQL